VRVVLLSPDLLFSSRIAGIVERAGSEFIRLDDPERLATTEPMDLLLVDWGSRDRTWSAALAPYRTGPSRIIPFGPHTDLEAHAASRAAGLGPMWARSRLLSSLADVLRATADRP
jgi:hypothetical protein